MTCGDTPNDVLTYMQNMKNDAGEPVLEQSHVKMILTDEPHGPCNAGAVWGIGQSLDSPEISKETRAALQDLKPDGTNLHDVTLRLVMELLTRPRRKTRNSDDDGTPISQHTADDVSQATMPLLAGIQAKTMLDFLLLFCLTMCPYVIGNYWLLVSP